MLIKRAMPLVAATALLLTGCTAVADDAGDLPQVLAAIYPLQFVAEQVAGELAVVGSVTPQGAEPHDLELAPAQVRALGAADVVVYVAGFQPALDEAVAAQAPGVVIDATAELGLALSHEDEDDEHDEEGEDEHDDDGDHSDHDHDGDPHFWLDPTLLARLAAPIAHALGDLDPTNADTYTANAERLVGELAQIDEEYAAGLASCERSVVVVSHEAYGYLAERYGLTQVGLSGLDPEGEPSPARLREIRATIAEFDVTTVFTESLVNPKAAEVLAEDLGLVTALLDPIEAQTHADADYRDVMRSNLDALTVALGCA